MNTDSNIYLGKSPKNEEGVYFAFKKTGKRLGLTTCLPVARISLNPTLKINFYTIPTLSKEEKEFIKIEAKKLKA